MHSFGNDFGPEPHHDEVRVKLIATALASSGDSYRIAVICAVFGLLSLIGSEAEASRNGSDERRGSQSSDGMSYQALSVVFAPLLIGDMIDDIELRHQEVELSRGNGVPSPGHLSKASLGGALNQDVLALHLGQTSVALQVTKMLIAHWIAVVEELHKDGLSGAEQWNTLPSPVGGALDYDDRLSRTNEYISRAQSLDMLRGPLRTRQARPVSMSLEPRGHHHKDPAWEEQDEDSTKTATVPSRARDINPVKLFNKHAGESTFGQGTRQYLKRFTLQTQKRDRTKTAKSFSMPSKNISERVTNQSHVDMQTMEVSAGLLRPISGTSTSVVENREFDGSPPQPRRISQQLSTMDGGRPEQGSNSHRPNGTPSPKLEPDRVPSSSDQPDEHITTVETRPSPGANGVKNAGSPVRLSNEASSIPRKASPPQIQGPSLQPFPATRGDHGLSSSSAYGARSSSLMQGGGNDLASQQGLDQLPVRKTRACPASKAIKSPKSTGYLPPSHVQGSTLQVPPKYEIPYRRSSWVNGVDSRRRRSGVRVSSDGSIISLVNHHSSPHLLNQYPQQANARRDTSTHTFQAPRPPNHTTDISVPPSYVHHAPQPHPSLRSASVENMARLPQRTDRVFSDDGSRPPQSPSAYGLIAGSAQETRQQASGLAKGNATLYAEVQRLQRQLDLKTEEAKQSQRQLEAARNFKDSSKALSEQLRDTLKELNVWKARAEWAERRLSMQEDWETRRS